MRKLTIILLALTMIGCLLSATAFAATVESGTCGDNLTWILDDAGTLTISGEGKMEHFLRGEAPWSHIGDLIRTVVIDDGVTSVGEYAFADLAQLRTIHIPASVEEIGGGFSAGCVNLTQYTVSSDHTVFETNGRALRKKLGDYWDCYEEIVAVVPGTAGNYGIRSTLRIGDHAFEGVTGLTQLTISTGVSSDAFDFDDSEFGTAAVLDEIGVRAFAGCTGLTTLTIPGGLERIESQAFAGCTNLETIYFVGDAPEIAADAFDGVTATICYVPDNTTWTEAVRQNYGGNLTWKSERTTSGTVDEGVFWKFDEASGTLTISGSGPMTYMEYRLIPWYSCFNLIRNIVIEDGITSLASNLFHGCTTVESVVMADSVANVKYYAFAGCSNLRDLTLSEGLRSIDSSAFSGCHSLVCVDLPASLQEFYPKSFVNCSNLKEFRMDPENERFVSVDGVVFSKDMKTIWLVPGGLEGDYVIPGTVERFGDMGVFSGCIKLTGVTIPEGVTSFEFYSQFSGCTGLTTVNLPQTLETISGYSFNDCTALEKITIPASVKTIGNNAFANCTNLKTIIFEGDAPSMKECSEYIAGSFPGVTATAYIPAGNTTWTAGVTERDYGGDITWCVAGMAGDISGDGTVDFKDVAWLLWHTLFPDSNEITGDADFNGDGKVNDADVAYLLWHTLFPENYPL